MKRPRRPHAPSDASATPRTPEPAPGTVRIIGGLHRGRILRSSGDPRTRPMKDRVREAVFNLIGTDVAGTHVVDLFAGTGALGLEAISRGALAATFFERHFPTADLIAENAKTIGVSEQCQIIPANTLVQFRKALPFVGPDPTVPWSVFCSPPYDLYVQQTAEMLGLIETIANRAPAKSLIVVECDERFDTLRLPDGYHWDVREYPPARIAIWTKP